MITFRKTFAKFAGTFLPENYWFITLRKLHISVLQQLKPISNVWENSRLFPFWGNFKSVSLPAFIKEGKVSIRLYLFEKLYLHVNLVIYTKNIFHKSSKLIAYLTPNLGYLPKRHWWSEMLFPPLRWWIEIYQMCFILQN